MTISVGHIIALLWIGIGLVWLVGALLAKRAERKQSVGSRVLHTLVGALAFFIGFTRQAQNSVLSTPFVPNSPVTSAVGILLTLAGIGFAIWARFHLGRNWSGIVMVKKDHTLITSGAYRIVRHPIYSGLLLATVGTAIAFREVRGLISVGLFTVLAILKLRLEERFMTEEFGEQYAEYRRQVKALIPGVY